MDFKTTIMMEEAVKRLAELPEGQKVYITGPHGNWLRELEREFKKAGLVDVEFVSMDYVLQGKLRGVRGNLMIDDVDDCTWQQLERLAHEQVMIGR